MVSIRLHNTLSGTKETFEPRGPRVTMYVCGMTPKFDPHLGHAKLFVTMDVIRRYLTERGHDVKYVQNFTDVDDKIIARGLREGLSPKDVAQKYTDSYFRSMDALNVEPAEIYPKATETIPEIIDMIQGLIASGHAYPAEMGDVFYSVDSFPSYGKLSHRTSSDVMAGARIQVEPEKRDPRDFALWKAARPGEPAWDSPWGPGRPGWHIECSAMIRTWLGDQIDIHGGGPDLIFPHHENEIAQSEAFTGKEPFVRYWVHIGQLNVGNEKMAHSTENFTTVLELIERYHPAVIRLYLLSQQYRQPVNFSLEALDERTQALERLVAARDALRSLRQAAASDIGTVAPSPSEAGRALAQSTERMRADFYDAMDDDFNTASALADIFTFARAVNRYRDHVHAEASGPAPDAEVLERGLHTYERLVGLLGLALPTLSDLRGLAGGRRPAGASAAASDDGTATSENTIAALAVPDDEVERRLSDRAELRKERRYAEADAIRTGLEELGVTIEDHPSGTTWRRAR